MRASPGDFVVRLVRISIVTGYARHKFFFLFPVTFALQGNTDRIASDGP